MRSEKEGMAKLAGKKLSLPHRPLSSLRKVSKIFVA
jgi:hypothetical protein